MANPKDKKRKMLDLFRRPDDAEIAPDDDGGDLPTIDLTLTFEPGFAVLTAPTGARFRITRPDLETLLGPNVAKQRLVDAEGPAKGATFGQPVIEKAAAIARYLGHDMTMSQIAEIFGEKEPDLRSWYGWAINQHGWGDNPAHNERLKMSELDRVRAVPMIPGGIVDNNGVWVGALTGVPVPEEYKRLNGRQVAKALNSTLGDVEQAADALRVSRDDLRGWIERNGEIIKAFRAQS